MSDASQAVIDRLLEFSDRRVQRIINLSVENNLLKERLKLADALCEAVDKIYVKDGEICGEWSTVMSALQAWRKQ